ncbi:MAG: Uncharacterized protein G01um10147_996 [Microgenomates group bacterium Gr01-1014_7]|nr:MAG: Uncharacterized protein G01um10147_996 [Microgenomates group bacterium Gr01-1014_7]
MVSDDSANLTCVIIGCMVKDYEGLKKQAIRLRKEGLSYGEISKDSGIPKSTLSYWLKNIPLERHQKERFYTKQIQYLSLGAQSQKERRKREIEEIINLAAEEISLPITPDAYRLIGAALYWAEGSKGGMLEMTNSDPHLILFFVRWTEIIFNIPAINLKARLNIYPQQNESEVKKFWSELTDIPVKNFGKTYVKPFSSGYKKNNLYYGTMRIEVPKSTNMKHKVFGWLKAVLSENEMKVKLVQRKWQKLAGTSRPINL